ncbi:MAG: GntR family transcriptional regulator [Betaproteobacteria bacterium]|nr:GntR family transcriptional regulator [Betaproteobacteria bacterium]MCC7215209.1 GntR family transcriptional regulator [Burkholderiales bacterium]
MQPYPATIRGGTEQPIYDAIFEAVLDQRLAPGTRLTETRLTELFGVSRTIVRMALVRLAHDHIVQLTPNQGASIARPSPEETRAVFEARRMVECAALPAAVARALPKQLDHLRALVRQEDAAFHAGDVKSWIRLSGEFHCRLAALARNPVMLHYTTELVTQSLLMTALYMPPGQTTCATDEHLALIDAIAAKDERLARSLMQRHLDACEARLALDRVQALPADLAEALRVRRRRAAAAR